jgi:hypothetical protein
MGLFPTGDEDATTDPSEIETETKALSTQTGFPESASTSARRQFGPPV